MGQPLHARIWGARHSSEPVAPFLHQGERSSLQNSLEAHLVRGVIRLFSFGDHAGSVRASDG
jgi:hypothetical protein